MRALTETMPATSPLRFVLHGGVSMLRTLADQEGAVETMQAARDSARALGDVFLSGMYTEVLAEARIRRGELEQADHDLAELLEYYRGAGMRPYIARALDLLAELRDHEERSDEAEAARAEASEIRATMRVPAA